MACSRTRHSAIENVMPRARPNAEPLFSTYDFHGLQEHRRQKMASEIGQASPELINTGDVEELAKYFAEKNSLEMPTLIEGALSISAEEQLVDVTGDFRFGAFGPGPNYVAGVRVSYFLLFQAIERCSAARGTPAI